MMFPNSCSKGDDNFGGWRYTQIVADDDLWLTTIWGVTNETPNRRPSPIVAGDDLGCNKRDCSSGFYFASDQNTRTFNLTVNHCLWRVVGITATLNNQWKVSLPSRISRAIVKSRKHESHLLSQEHPKHKSGNSVLEIVIKLCSYWWRGNSKREPIITNGNGMRGLTLYWRTLTTGKNVPKMILASVAVLPWRN